MPVVIDATAGGASANSFVTLVEADAYVATRLNASLWETSASTDTKNRALVEATREINVLSWRGLRSTITQALAWPQQYALDPDSPYAYYFDTTTVPQRVKDATMELALQFVKSGTTDLAALDSTISIKREKVDVIETEYTEPYQRAQGLERFPRVWDLVRPLTTAMGAVVPTMRG